MSDNEGEYYEAYDIKRDGGMYLYNKEYKNTIPGYLMFCEDKKDTNPSITEYELGYSWDKLKKDNFVKYNEYISKYIILYPNKYAEYVKKWKK